MLPVVRELEAQYAERVDFQVLDYYSDATKPFLAQYAVRGHPTFMALARDGTPSTPLFGIVDKDQLVTQIEAALT